MTIPMTAMPRDPRTRGTLPRIPPRAPESLQWPMALLLEKFTKYRGELVKEVADLIDTRGLVQSVNGRSGVVTVGALDVGLGNVVDTGDSAVPVDGGLTKFTTGGAFTELAKKVSRSELFDNPDASPTVKSSLLPSYVDDVLEYASLANFPSPGETGKIYVAKDENKNYRWGGTQYVQVGGGDQAQADWGQTDAGAVDFIKNKPATMPPSAHVHSQSDVTGLADALAGKLSRTEAEAGWTQWKILRDGVDVTAQVSQPTYNASFGTWDVSESRVSEDTGGQGEITDSADAVSLSWGAGGATGYHSYTASRIRLPKTADIPTKTSDLTNDGSDGEHPFISQNDVQHQQLTPVYSDTPTYGFGDWTVSAPSGAIYDADDLSVSYEEASPGEYSWWLFDGSTAIGTMPSTSSPNATEVKWTLDVEYTATRTAIRTDIIGYTLGSQSAKPLAALAELSALAAGQQLTPVYGGNGQRFGDWTVTSPDDPLPYRIAWFDGTQYGGASGWVVERNLHDDYWEFYSSVKGNLESTSLSWAPDDITLYNYTATRAENPVTGYTLGAQTPHLQPQGDYAPATALRYDLPANATAISSASSEVVEGETVTYGEATLADRTANIVAITAAIAELRLTFPAAVSGKVRDFGLRIEVGTGSAALTAPALVPPAGVTLENADGAVPALADGAADAKGVTLLYFSETSPGVFLVKGEEVKEA